MQHYSREQAVGTTASFCVAGRVRRGLRIGGSGGFQRDRAIDTMNCTQDFICRGEGKFELATNNKERKEAWRRQREIQGLEREERIEVVGQENTDRQKSKEGIEDNDALFLEELEQVAAKVMNGEVSMKKRWSWILGNASLYPCKYIVFGFGQLGKFSGGGEGSK